MALSDYDALAFGWNGEPSAAHGKLYGGWEVGVRKTYVWIKSLVHREKCGKNTRPLTMTLDEGHLSLNGMSVDVRRSKTSSAVFVFASSSQYKKDASRYRHFAAIGCSGYDDREQKIADYLGIDLSQWDNVTGGISCSQDGDFYTVNVFNDDDEGMTEYYIPEYGNENLDNVYVGVTAEVFGEFMEFLEEVTPNYPCATKEWYEKVKAAVPLRYNQGDEFFSHHLGTSMAATPIGGVEEEPVAMMLIAAMGDGNRKPPRVQSIILNTGEVLKPLGYKGIPFADFPDAVFTEWGWYNDDQIAFYSEYEQPTAEDFLEAFGDEIGHEKYENSKGVQT